MTFVLSHCAVIIKAGWTNWCQLIGENWIFRRTGDTNCQNKTLERHKYIVLFNSDRLSHCHECLDLFGFNKLDINEFSAIQAFINLLAYLNSFIYIDLLVCNNSSCNVHKYIFFIYIEWVIGLWQVRNLKTRWHHSYLFLCDLSAFHDAVPTMFLSPPWLNMARSQCVVLGYVLKVAVLL